MGILSFFREWADACEGIDDPHGTALRDLHVRVARLEERLPENASRTDGASAPPEPA